MAVSELRCPWWKSQAEAEGLTLLEADNKVGYFGVYLDKSGKRKPYQAQVRRGGKKVTLGTFVTAEEAALCIARSPEGQAATKQAAPQVSEEEGKGTVPPMPPGAFVKEEEFPPMPPGAFVKEEVVVKREHEVVDEGGRSDGGRPKRQKNA